MRSRRQAVDLADRRVADLRYARQPRAADARRNRDLNLDFAGLGGDTKYVRLFGQASKFWNIGRGFILSVTGQSGYIYGFENVDPGSDPVHLTDRFFMGEADVRGFDIRGLGPRVVRRFYDTSDPNNPVLLPIDDKSTQDDSLGGTAMYVVRTEVEIPMSSGVRELGIRPSVFFDVGSVFGIVDPILTVSPYPNGIFIPQRDASGNALYTQIDSAVLNNSVCTPTKTSVVTSPTNPNPPPASPARTIRRSAARCRRSSRSSTAIRGSRVSRSALASTGSRRSVRSGSTSLTRSSITKATIPRSSPST